MIPDYYKILNISRNTTIGEIKKAYRKLALQWHPDVNKNPKAHEMFISINEAYLILSDNLSRWVRWQADLRTQCQPAYV